MKHAIFTLSIGSGNPMYSAAIDSFRHYAKRIGAELEIATELHYPIKFSHPKHAASPAWTEKLYINELLKKYDRVLYLDADVIVTPHARNIFEECPALDTVYMLDEGKLTDRSPEINSAFNVFGKLNDWPVYNGHLSYYNAGIILVSKECPLFSKATINEMQLGADDVRHYDQTYFNYVIHKHGIKNQSLAPEFNRMDLFGKDSEYKNADFIHYAGRGYSKNGRRREIKFIQDYCDFFANQLSKQEIQQLKSDTWQTYLPKVYKKFPALPKPLLRALCRTFVAPLHNY